MQPQTTLPEPPTISLPYKWPFSNHSDAHLLLTRRSNTGGDAPDVSFTGEARYKGDSFTSEVSVTFADKDRDSKLWPHGLHVESVQVAMPESLSVEGFVPDDESSYHCESGCVYDLPNRSVEASVKAVYGRDEQGRHSMYDRSIKGHKTQVVSLQERLFVQPGTKIDFTGAPDTPNTGSLDNEYTQSLQGQEPKSNHRLTLDYPNTPSLFDDLVSSPMKGYYTLTKVGDRYTAIVDSKKAIEPWIDPVDKESAIVIPVRDVQTAIDNAWDVSEHGEKSDLNEMRSLRVRLASVTPCSANDTRAPELEYDSQTNLLLASARAFTCESELAQVRRNGNLFANMPPISVGAEIGVTWKVDPSKCPALQDRISRGEKLTLGPDDFASERLASVADGSLPESQRGGRSSPQLQDV